MGSIPSGWPTAGLQPRIRIYDWEGNLAYTYEHPQIAVSPTQDMKLYGYSFDQGIGTNFGLGNLLIHDHENLLTDLTSSRRPSKIKNEFTVIADLGRTSGTLNTWFRGRIREGSITRLPQQQFLEITMTGLGTLLPDRHTIMNYQQDKDSSDPLEPDDSDNDSKASETAKNMITEAKNYLNPTLPVLPFTVNGIEDDSIKLVNFDKRPGTKIDVALNEIANSTNKVWGIDYSNNDIFMRYSGSASTGILVTNDLDSSLTQNWNQDKMCMLLSRTRKYSDSTIGAGYGNLVAMGALNPSVDVDNTASNANLSLSDWNHAIEFTPTKDNVWIIAPFLARNGTPSKDLHICLIPSDVSGEPDTSTILQRRIIRKEDLQALPAVGKYYQMEFDRVNVAPNTKIFIYFEKYGDASNDIDLKYQTGSGVYWTSSDGTTWNDPQVGGEGKLVGLAKMRVYSAKTIQINYENTSMSKLYGNKLYPKENLMSLDGIHEDTAIDIITSVATTRSRQRRMYEPITITAPSAPIELAKTIRYIDKFNGMDITADVTHYRISANAYDLNANGVHEVTVNIEEPFSVV